MISSSKYIHTKKIIVAVIGDLSEVLCATPFIHNLKKNWPDKRIDVLVTSRNNHLAAGWPFITSVNFFNENYNFLEQISYFQSLAKQYDLFISITPSLAGYAAAHFSKALHRIGVVPRDPIYLTYAAKFLLTTSVTVDFSVEPSFSKKFPHEVEVGYKLNNEMGIKTLIKEIFLEPDKKIVATVDELEKEWNTTPKVKKICLHISRPWLTQNWDMNEFPKLVSALQKGYHDNCLIIFLCDPENANMGNELAATFKDDPLVKTVSNLSIIQQAELIKRCSVAITTDRHIMQMSAAVQTPVVAIYPRNEFEINAQRWAPWRVNNKRLVQKLPSQLINDIYSSAIELDEAT
jgi:ADP-heptose:LPS heptosyltransferase